MRQTYRRTRTPEGSGVTVRESGQEIRLSAGSSQRMRCTRAEAYALLAVLAKTLRVQVTGAPDWIAEAEIEVSDR
jgi:hypothetical protein